LQFQETRIAELAALALLEVSKRRSSAQRAAIFLRETHLFQQTADIPAGK